jgi:hypothetical protein
VNGSYRKILRNRKRRIERRLDPNKAWSNQPAPMLTASNIHYEMAERQRGAEIVRMELRRFLHALILLPAQIVRTGRRIIYRILAYNGWVKDLFAAWERLRCLWVT